MTGLAEVVVSSLAELAESTGELEERHMLVNPVVNTCVGILVICCGNDVCPKNVRDLRNYEKTLEATINELKEVCSKANIKLQVIFAIPESNWY